MILRSESDGTYGCLFERPDDYCPMTYRLFLDDVYDAFLPDIYDRSSSSIHVDSHKRSHLQLRCKVGRQSNRCFECPYRDTICFGATTCHLDHDCTFHCLSFVHVRRLSRVFSLTFFQILTGTDWTGFSSALSVRTFDLLSEDRRSNEVSVRLTEL